MFSRNLLPNSSSGAPAMSVGGRLAWQIDRSVRSPSGYHGRMNHLKRDKTVPACVKDFDFYLFARKTCYSFSHLSSPNSCPV